MFLQFVPDECTEIADVGDEVHVHYTVSIAIQYNTIKLFLSRTVVDCSRIWGTGSRRAAKGGYTLRVVREVRCIYSQRLNVSNVLDSLVTAGNSFQMVGAEKLKERLLKLVVQEEGIHKRFWLAERRHRDGWYTHRRFLRYGGWLVKRLLCVKRAILNWIESVAHCGSVVQWS